MKGKIIAVDFDGCLVENKYPDIGGMIKSTVDALLAEQSAGTKIILWTCRRAELLHEAVRWCNDKGIIFDEINKNLPEIIEEFGEDTRKIFASEYWDDRAVRMPVAKDITEWLQYAIKKYGIPIEPYLDNGKELIKP